MTTDRDAFLRAIAESPDEDAPRLVFADWLDEQGEPERAEFIRVQCAAEAWPGWHAEQDRLERRVADLLSENQPTWERALPSTAPSSAYERGFLDRIALRDENVLATFPTWVGVLPPVRLDLIIRPETAIVLAGMPELANLRRVSLQLPDGVGGSVLWPLLRSPWFTGITELDASWLDLGDAEVAAFTHWPGLTRLRHLEFEGRATSLAGRALSADTDCLAPLDPLSHRYRAAAAIHQLGKFSAPVRPADRAAPDAAAVEMPAGDQCRASVGGDSVPTATRRTPGNGPSLRGRSGWPIWRSWTFSTQG